MPTPEELQLLSIDASNQLREIVDTKIQSINEKVLAKEQEVDEFILNARAEAPVTANFLADTYKFAGLCGGLINDEQAWDSGGFGGNFGAFLDGGATINCTVKVVDVANFATNGIGHGGDLNKAAAANFSGSLFNAVIIDITFLTSGNFFFMTQNLGFFTGWTHGETQTQASAMINLIECTNTPVKCYVQNNASPTLIVDKSHLGQGWKYLHSNKIGVGGTYQPKFVGIAGDRMKIAIALPYFGMGNNGGKFIYAAKQNNYLYF